MMRFLATTTVALLLSAAAALPQAGLGPVIQALEDQGYTVTNTIRETNRIRIQAQSGNATRELVYDSRTGKLLSDDIAPLRDRDRDRDRLQDGTHDGDPDRDQDRDQDRDRDGDGGQAGEARGRS